MMPKSPWLTIAAATFAAAALTTSCDKIPIDPGSAVGAAAGCPDVSSLQAIASVDWAAEFGLEAAMGAQIKGGLSAALELQAFAAKLDAELKAACGGLATDLGATGDFADGPAACKAAAAAMADVRGKLGGGVKIALAIDPPRCSASLDAMASCVAECDASVEPGSVKVECEPGKLAGSCDAECSGSCSMEAGAKCEGTCHGSCDASFSGTCGGECTGKCDGKKVTGAACAGTCAGSCTAQAEGSCGGNCSGSCELKAAAKCEGTCTGSCSVEMKAPRCEGKVQPPKASAECNASCETKVQADVQCTPARVNVVITGAADAALAAKYKAALQAHLPAVLKVAIGMKDQALGVAANVKDVAGGVTASIKALKASPQVGARLTACVAAPFKGAFDAAASIKANVDVSVEVKASASVSGSAGGSASAG
jgi:hypothetical protein